MYNPNSAMEVAQITQLLLESLSSDGPTIHKATDALDRLSSLSPNFPFYLLAITAGNDQALQIAAATYLKNFIRRNIDANSASFEVTKAFKEQFMQVLLQAEFPVLKVLVEAFRVIVTSEFVKKDSWPELVPDLQSVIQSTNLMKQASLCQWKTINSLVALQSIIRPFQYFLNPKVAKEPIPPQLELIAKNILEPLLAGFHQFVEKALSGSGETENEVEKVLLLICKCMYLAVRSHMPSSLPSRLPSFCGDLFRILASLRFDGMETPEEGHLLRIKTGKRSLQIFCTLITRHRKYSDKLLPDIIHCVLNIVKHSRNISKIDFPEERVISLAFDVISHVLEIGPGWRLVSPHFSFLLDSAIFPTLIMNQKDIMEWEEDADEYIRKNLPSDLEEISGWKEDLFTVRKSAMNLLGVMSISKGPPMTSLNKSSSALKRKKGENRKKADQHFSVGELLVLPYLSKFPVPCDSQLKTLNDYYGVLMAYGGLQDFLKEQKPEYVVALIRTRVLPLYTLPSMLPYLVGTANWVLGELASCLPEEMNADVYSSLLRGLEMPDTSDISSYPVRASAAGAIVALLESDYLPPEWLPILRGVTSQFGKNDEETSIFVELLGSVVEAGDENVAVHVPFIVSSLAAVISRHILHNSEPWPHVVERGFAALAIMAKSLRNFMPDEDEADESSENWLLGLAAIARDFSALLQQAWLMHPEGKEGKSSPPPFIDDSPTLLLSIMHSITDDAEIIELKVSELLLVWSGLIADWHGWEESEDLSVFDCIEEVINLHKKFNLKNFIERTMPPPPAPPVPEQSIIESIGFFVSEAISKYPSATQRGCSCVHLLLHVPSYLPQTEVKHSLVTSFSHAAFSRFMVLQSKPCSMWKPLLLAVSSCYLCYPDVVEETLENEEKKGFAIWASALAMMCTSPFKPDLSSQLRLTVMTLAKVVERLIIRRVAADDLLRVCFASLMETSLLLDEVQKDITEADEDEVEDEDDEVADQEDDSSDETEEDEDSEDDEHEETNEEFHERYAQAAADLEKSADIEDEEADDDQNQEPELGHLEAIDQEQVVWSLMEKYHSVLVQIAGELPPLVISKFLNTFPNYNVFFQAT